MPTSKRIEKNHEENELNRDYQPSIRQPSEELRQEINLKEKKRAVRKKKDENFGWRRQNKDRNLISDILKEYLQFTQN